MVLRFGDFELDVDALELSRDGDLLPLAPQPTRVLAFLVQNAGRTVSREELQRHVWGDEHVEADLGLNSCVRKIRTQLDDDANDPRFVRTLPRRGYRFVGELRADETKERGIARNRRWSWVAALAVVVGATFWLTRSLDKASQSTEEPVAVAVLPFQNLTGDPSQGFVSDGLTEETIARLGRLGPRQLAVIARTTAMQVETGERSAAAIAEELDVQFLVEGSVRRDNGRLRATARLIDGETGLQTGSEIYEASADDLLQAQASLADHLAQWLVDRLLPGEHVVARAPEPLTGALYETYLQGLHLLQQGTVEGYREAEERFARVVGAEPTSALGWSGLAEARLWQRWFGADSPELALTEARTAARRAIELDPALANPHLLLGYAALYVDFDSLEAERHLERAAALEPGSARAQAWLAAYLSAAGEHDEAIERAQLARRLDPLAMAVNSDLCWLLNYARRFDQALVACSNALEIQAGNGWIRLGKIEALRQLGRDAEAVEIVAEMAAAAGDDGAAAWTDLASTDPRAAGEHALAWLATVAARQPGAYMAATVAALQGHEEIALERLDAAWEERSMLLVFAAVDPRFDSIRESPRFREMVDRVGLNASAS